MSHGLLRGAHRVPDEIWRCARICVSGTSWSDRLPGNDKALTQMNVQLDNVLRTSWARPAS